ncbi:MAG: Threonine-phosphate decarboxylase [Pseudomonas citronellolis]|nr:MAG: Threonine-phosphate decarboxylase [Pseudomonas citronellolis]
MLEHGGRLRQAAQRYGIALADWLDLSTGIAPWPWPLPAIDASAWQRLPEEDDGLEAAAAQYYGAARVLPLPGSQAAIQSLPRLRQAGRVGVLSPCYAEHAHAWQRAGHDLCELGDHEVDAQLGSLDALVVINPNNPTGRRVPRERLLAWHAVLQRRGGWLVVDEAFMDASAEHSLAGEAGQRPGLIVLRSFGKFFGMAGARLGFAFGEASLLDSLRETLGPWAVSGPTRQVAQSLLGDTAAHAERRRALDVASARLAELLARHALPAQGGCALFQWLLHPHAAALHEHLARHGILVRLFAAPSSVRFGLPPDEAAWVRLDAALAGFRPDENPT